MSWNLPLSINNLTYTVKKNTQNILPSTDAGHTDFDGSISADSFIKTNGLSTQYLMADGSTTNSSGDANLVNIIDANPNISTSFIGDILPSSHNSYDLGEGGTSFRDIYANRLLSPNGLTSLTIANNNTSTFTGTVEANILKKVGGTNIQYLMADGSSLTQSASSGNSNFYLYKINFFNSRLCQLLKNPIYLIQN